MIGRNPTCNGIVCGLRQRIVLQQRDLEFQNVRHLTLNRFHQSDDLGCRSFDRRLQCGGFLRRVADRRPSRAAGGQHDDRPDGEAR